MKRKELTETFMMILNLKDPLVSLVYTKNYSVLQRLIPLEWAAFMTLWVLEVNMTLWVLEVNMTLGARGQYDTLGARGHYDTLDARGQYVIST